MTTKPTKHRCLYEILGVDIKSTSQEIAKGYKKAALKWHPDRNIHNSEEATERFKEVNEAYSVLSDKHERAWYDSVREKLLKGIDPNSQVDPNNIDLTYYISPFAFNGYDDTSNNNQNYYQVYNDLFNQIIELEARNKSKTPKFGNSKSQWSKIRKFYNFWEDFRSIRNFNWTSKWNLNNANNRRERKYMQKENNKLKSDKKKEFEQMVSKLVKFVKKRDPRFQKHLIDLEKERMEQEKKQKEYEEELRQIEKEIREEENRKRQELYLQKLQQNNNMDEFFDDNDNDMIHNDMYHCIACNKYFKSQNGKKNHTKSKKHMKNVENLRKQLKLEEKLLIKSMNTSDKSLDNGNKDHEEPNILLDEMIAKQLQSEFDIDFSFLNKDFTNNNNNNNNDNNNNNNNDNNINNNNNVDYDKYNSNNNTNSKLQSDDVDHLLAQQLEQQEIKSMANYLNNSVPLIDEKDKLIIETEISDEDLDKLLSQGIKMEELLDNNGNLDVKKINQMKRRVKKMKRQKNRNLPDSDSNNEGKIVINTNDNDNDNDHDNDNNNNEDDNDSNNNNNDNEFKKVKRRRRRKKNQLKAQHEYKSTIFSCLYCANKFKTKHHLINHLRANPKHKKPYEQLQNVKH